MSIRSARPCLLHAALLCVANYQSMWPQYSTLRTN